MQEEALQGNENIEQAIAALQQNATPELLAHALTAIRRRIRENGQFVVAVEPNPGTTQMNLKVVQTPTAAPGGTPLPALRRKCGAPSRCSPPLWRTLANCWKPP